jgi:integrase
MSVRQRTWKDAQGRERSAWLVDVEFTHADGRVERVQKTSPVNSRRGAQQYERDLRTALLTGRYGKESQVPTVAEMALELLEHTRLRRKFSTGIFYGLMLEKHIVPTLGRLRLTEVTGERIDRFARSLTDGRKPKTVNNVLGVLGRLLRFSVSRGALKVAPPVGKLTLPPGIIRFLSFDEAEAFITAARESSNWTAQIIVALRTGLRIGELLALRWEDVDLAGGGLLVRRSVWKHVESTPKGGRPREVPLSDQALEALREHPRRGPYVFSTLDGQRRDRHGCTRALYAIAERAGQQLPFGWHVLRHTFASHLVMRGVPLKAVQELMGHATMDMTLRYAHLSPDVRRDAVQLLDGPAQHGRNTKQAPQTSPHGAWGKTAGELGFEPR